MCLESSANLVKRRRPNTSDDRPENSGRSRMTVLRLDDQQHMIVILTRLYRAERNKMYRVHGLLSEIWWAGEFWGSNRNATLKGGMIYSSHCKPYSLKSGNSASNTWTQCRNIVPQKKQLCSPYNYTDLFRLSSSVTQQLLVFLRFHGCTAPEDIDP